MDEPNLENLEIKIAKLREGDILVLRSDLALSLDQIKRMKTTLEELLDEVGLRHKVAVVILDHGMKLDIFRKEVA